jgi:riboflavin biosynthesis pyrimidine reductase
MNALTPLETLYASGRDGGRGGGSGELPLPPDLLTLYGPLQFPPHPGRAYLIGNFVTTLDGVVSLGVPGHAGGGEISGFNQHDHLVMGLLRASADAVIVGAGTLRSVPTHLWTAAYINPPQALAYQTLRITMGKPEPPLTVIVTARGELNLDLPVFQSGTGPVLIVTTAAGFERISAQPLPSGVEIATVHHPDAITPDAISPDAISAQEIVEAAQSVRQSDIILVEGGPRLMGDFFAERCLHELFLTLAPQLAGRDDAAERPGLVTGQRFAPERPLWGTLIGVKRGGSHLFLRYAFETKETAP